MVHVDLGAVEAVLPRPSKCQGVIPARCPAALLRRRGPQRSERAIDHCPRTHPNLVRKLFALEIP
jgi:hypothetical protein